MVTVAVIPRLLLSPYVDGRLPFAILMLALVVVSTMGGVGPGLLTLVVGCLASMWLFLPPIGSLRVEGLPFQITLGAYILVGLLIIALGEAFRRAQDKASSYQDLLGIDFKQTGDIFVRSPVGIRHLTSKPAATAARPTGTSVRERPLDRIISEILPGVAETATVPQWEIRANGKPIVNIELRDSARCIRCLRRWVVTYVNPVESSLPVEEPY